MTQFTYHRYAIPSGDKTAGKLPVLDRPTSTANNKQGVTTVERMNRVSRGRGHHAAYTHIQLGHIVSILIVDFLIFNFLI
jgi:hypothetical protein